MSQVQFRNHRFAIKQGYLTKSPPLHKKTLAGWKKRWCILEHYGADNDVCLSYYSDEETSFTKMPKDRIFLSQCSKVEVDLRHSSYVNIFSIHIPGRIYYFSASSHYEMTEWADTLCKSLSLINDDPYPTDPLKKSWSLPHSFLSRNIPPKLQQLPKSLSDYDSEQRYVPSQGLHPSSNSGGCDSPHIGCDSPPMGRGSPLIGCDSPNIGRDTSSVDRDSCSPPPPPPPRRWSNEKQCRPLPPPPPPHKSSSSSPPDSPSHESMPLPPPPPPHKSSSSSPPDSPSHESMFSSLLPPPPPPPRRKSAASA